MPHVLDKEVIKNVSQFSLLLKNLFIFQKKMSSDEKLQFKSKVSFFCAKKINKGEREIYVYL